MPLPALLAPLLAGAALLAAQSAPPTSPAQTAPQGPATPPPAPALPAPVAPPRLLVVISVDQFAADLFAQYRRGYTGGFARLLDGAVFPDAFQSHAATETCPGHSTILTGMHPEHTGIIANTWVDQRVARADKKVYCAEDEGVPGSDHEHYTVSDRHLRVPTLGEMMKAANPATRVVSVAGKDRAAVMMGGHQVDELWWWDGRAFVSYAGRAAPAAVTGANRAVAALLGRPQEALPLTDACRRHDAPVRAGETVVGQGRFARGPNDAKAWRASPMADASVFALAAALVRDMGLGRGPATDLISIGASATDYIGHAYGTQGTEMCLQMAQLDESMDGFFRVLDGLGIDYEVALTADHGGHDLAERQQQRAMPADVHAASEVKADAMAARIAAALHLPGPVLLSAETKTSIDADVYIAAGLTPAQRQRVSAAAVREYQAMPQVAAVFTRADLAAAPPPTGSPDAWSLLDRARASWDAERSGDLVALLKPRVSQVVTPGAYYVEAHGSPWDYDRRVPLLFWRRGMAGFEQPLPVETVDIAPTLAATIGLPVHGLDGRCLDLDPGVGDTCRR